MNPLIFIFALLAIVAVGGGVKVHRNRAKGLGYFLPPLAGLDGARGGIAAKSRKVLKSYGDSQTRPIHLHA